MVAAAFSLVIIEIAAAHPTDMRTPITPEAMRTLTIMEGMPTLTIDPMRHTAIGGMHTLIDDIHTAMADLTIVDIDGLTVDDITDPAIDTDRSGTVVLAITYRAIK
jgi:hypothetical protein